MARFIDPFYTNNFLDANIFDEIAYGQNETVKKILTLSDEEKVVFLLPYSVQYELQDPNTPESVLKASQGFNYSVEVHLTDNEKKLHEKLVEEVIGEAQAKNIARDLFHVFEASKYGGGHFITLDKRLLKRADTIAQALQIEVLTPESFLQKVHIAKRRNAELARRNTGAKTESSLVELPNGGIPVEMVSLSNTGEVMSLHREYKGVEINAHTERSGDLYLPVVVLTRHNAKDVAEVILHPPCEKVFDDEDDALKSAMEYGLDAIDGNVKGFDPNSLR